MAFLSSSPQLFAYNQDIDMANLLFFRNSQEIGIDFTLLSPALAHG
jgi:hypothetical protein